MAYNERERFILANKSFIEEYLREKDKWDQLGEEAKQHTENYIDDPRPDDAAPFLVAVLMVHDDFRLLLAERNLSARYWYVYFADLILDNIWP